MERYTVVESQRWQHTDGRTASPYGACPWTSEVGRAGWALVPQGWTIADNMTNTVGMGRVPWKTRDEAQAQADKWNAERAERVRYAESLRRA